MLDFDNPQGIITEYENFQSESISSDVRRGFKEEFPHQIWYCLVAIDQSGEKRNG